MKIICNREALLGACLAAGAATPSKTDRPILRNLLLATSGPDAVSITGSDLDVGARVEIAAETPRGGEALVGFSQLAQILRECDDPTVTINSGPDGTSVRVGSSRFDLPAWSPAEYPALPEAPPGGGYHEIAAGSLRSLIRRVGFAIGKETTRFALQGVLWEADGRDLRLVATDSRILAVSEAPATFHGKAPGKAAHVVPKRAIALLEKHLTDDGEMVRVSLAGNEATFRTERATVYTRLIDGRFPPYRDIMGQAKRLARHTITLPTQSFLGRVRQAAVMAKDETCRVDVSFEPQRAVLRSRGKDIGSSEVEMTLPEHDGAAASFAADPEYLSDLLRSFDQGRSATLEMADGDKPLLFRDGDAHQVVLMPMSAA